MLLPFDETMAVILDDTNEVWPNSDNLVLADRFLYFQDHDDISKKYCGDNDNYLNFITDLLIKVHSKFYDDGCYDIKAILKELKSEVLKGTEIVLSGVISSEDSASKNYYWQLAQSFGSTCTRDITNTTTHIVATNIGTKKTKLGLKRGLPVLHLLWLNLSTSFWCRLPEDYFTFENIQNFEIRAILTPTFTRRVSNEDNQIHKKFKSQSSESESDAQITDE
jgi:BRCA1 C Terminus (BRCT) domain